MQKKNREIGELKQKIADLLGSLEAVRAVIEKNAGFAADLEKSLQWYNADLENRLGACRVKVIKELQKYK